MRALVTGGSGGIGVACAQRLRADGIEVAVLDVAPDADVIADVTNRCTRLLRISTRSISW
jgi:2-dehydro-3-deoxy-L-rhamnonate dehydrogenase (NAD+)